MTELPTLDTAAEYLMGAQAAYELAEQDLLASGQTAQQQADALGVTTAQFTELGALMAAHQRMIQNAVQQGGNLIQLTMTSTLAAELYADYRERHGMDLGVFRRLFVLTLYTLLLTPHAPPAAPEDPGAVSGS